jgi:hypothetical protein
MRRTWLLAILCSFVLTTRINAQTNYVVLSGVIMDPQHLAISSATVKLTSERYCRERISWWRKAGVLRWHSVPCNLKLASR